MKRDILTTTKDFPKKISQEIVRLYLRQFMVSHDIASEKQGE